MMFRIVVWDPLRKRFDFTVERNEVEARRKLAAIPLTDDENACVCDGGLPADNFLSFESVLRSLKDMGFSSGLLIPEGMR